MTANAQVIGKLGAKGVLRVTATATSAPGAVKCWHVQVIATAAKGTRSGSQGRGGRTGRQLTTPIIALGYGLLTEAGTAALSRENPLLLAGHATFQVFP